MQQARTSGEAGLFLLLAGHDITAGRHRQDGSSSLWEIPGPQGLQSFRFTLTQPTVDGLGEGVSTLIPPEGFVAFARTVVARLAPADRRYVAAVYEAFRADAHNGLLAMEQALRFFPEGADAIPADAFDEPPADPSRFTRAALERLHDWFGSLDGMYAQAQAEARRPRPVSQYPLPQGWFVLDDPQRAALAAPPFPLARIADYNPFAVVDG